jgi:hypothetical protein
MKPDAADPAPPNPPFIETLFLANDDLHVNSVDELCVRGMGNGALPVEARANAHGHPNQIFFICK